MWLFGMLINNIQVCNSFFPNYRRKKNKVVTTHKCLVVTEDDQNDVHVKENGHLHHRRVLPKKSVRKHKSSKLSESSALESDEISNDTTKSTPRAKRYLVASLYIYTCVCVTAKSRIFFLFKFHYTLFIHLFF
jgi:hypothetical protein